jgi:hypothetical protein
MPAQPRITAGFATVLANGTVDLLQYLLTGVASRFLERQDRNIRGAHPPTAPFHAVAQCQILDQRHGSVQGRDHGKAGRDHAGGVHGCFTDSKNRPGGDLSAGAESQIIETSDDESVGARLFALRDFRQQPRDGHRFIVLALDAGRARCRIGGDDLGSRTGGRARAGADLVSHGQRRVWIDHMDAHLQQDPLINLTAQVEGFDPLVLQ